MANKPVKIALVGTANSGAAAPYDDLDWKIWGVSARAAYVTRATRWFEIHRLDGEDKEWADAWRKTIKTFSHDVELLMFYPEPDLGPNVVAYPHQHIVDRFGTFFMTSSFAWMMALAIDELRPKGGKRIKGEIGIWGVEMEYGTEYAQQRAGFRHFIDMAKELGITVTRLAAGGLVYEPVPYPLWQDDPLLTKATKKKMQCERDLDDWDGTLQKTRTMIAENKAVLREIEKFGNGYDTKERTAKLEKELQNLMQTSANLSQQIMTSRGAFEELSWLHDYLQP